MSKPHLTLPLVRFLDKTTDETQAQQELTAFLAAERVCTRTDNETTLVIAVRLV